jgi:hypothetical protein
VAVLGEPLILRQVQFLCLLGNSVDVETIPAARRRPTGSSTVNVLMSNNVSIDTSIWLYCFGRTRRIF